MQLSVFKSTVIDSSYLTDASPLKGTPKNASQSAATIKPKKGPLGAMGTSTHLLDPSARKNTIGGTPMQTIPFSYIGQGFDFFIVQEFEPPSGENQTKKKK